MNESRKMESVNFQTSTTGMHLSKLRVTDWNSLPSQQVLHPKVSG